LQGLNVPSTGIPLDEHGIPHFDTTTLQCANAPIFMAGDVDGQRPVLHEASSQGAIAGRNAVMFPDVCPGKRAVPLSIMFTDPPLATIGAPPSDSTLVGVGSYADQGRAKIDACAAGVVRIYADGASGAITRAVLLGPGMDHIAHLFAWAVECRQTAADILKLPFYHPTLEEGLTHPLRQISESFGTCEFTTSRSPRSSSSPWRRCRRS
jgi:dihydrolipoamide dehydrogenase